MAAVRKTQGAKDAEKLAKTAGEQESDELMVEEESWDGAEAYIEGRLAKVRLTVTAELDIYPDDEGFADREGGGTGRRCGGGTGRRCGGGTGRRCGGGTGQRCGGGTGRRCGGGTGQRCG